MKRNLKFWTRYTFESAEATLVCAVVLAAAALFGAEGLDFATFATVMPYFLLISSVFMMLMINTGSHTLYVPLLLSMGETRRNVLLGFHYYRALIITITMAVCALIWLVAPGEVSAIGLRSIPTLLCVLIVASAIGSILGTLFVKWRWLSMVIIILICGGAGGTVGFASAAVDDVLSVAKTADIVSHLLKLPWWLVVAALAALAADIVFQWLLLRRQEVKL